MDKLEVENIYIQGNRIDVFFTTSTNLEKYFTKEKHFWMEYSIPVSDVPVGIAIIPFICNILPIIWIANIELILPEIDKTFFESIDKIKKGYVNIYPHISFDGKISATQIIDYTSENKNKGSALFFSGGVDACASLIAHIDEKPDLLTIWGADVALNDTIGWNNVKRDIAKTAELLDLVTAEIKSNFRSFLNPSAFKERQKAWNYNYWGYLHHGIGIIGHSVPYMYLKGYNTIYIASSFSPETRKNRDYAWASDPQIDNCVHFANTKVVHDLAEYTRQGKVDSIVAFSQNTKKQIYLRVCWESSGGKNCSQCEKCYRTIMGIIASGGNPNNFGFTVSQEVLEKIETYILSKAEFDWVKTEFWLEIQNKMKQNIILPEYEENTRWIIDYNFNEINNTLSKKARRFIRIKYGKVKSIIKKVLYPNANKY